MIVESRNQSKHSKIDELELKANKENDFKKKKETEQKLKSYIKHKAKEQTQRMRAKAVNQSKKNESRHS